MGGGRGAGQGDGPAAGGELNDGWAAKGGGTGGMAPGWTGGGPAASGSGVAGLRGGGGGGGAVNEADAGLSGRFGSMASERMCGSGTGGGRTPSDGGGETSGTGGGPCAMGAPHWPQNFDPGGDSCRHAVHFIGRPRLMVLATH